MEPVPEVPTTYENDLRDVVAIMDSFNETLDTHAALLKDAFVLRLEVDVWNGNDYFIGTIVYEDEQWRFTPHADWAE
jgi:hypothetical protein